MDSETTAQNHTAIDISGLIFFVCQSQEEFAQVLKCRWRGYKKYGFAYSDECRDEFDECAIHYLCKNVITNEVVGCLRMLSKLNGKLELESFVSISDWTTEGVQPAELTRFSVPISKCSTAIKFGLWKLAWLDAVRRGHTHFVIWTRKEARRNYDILGFDFLLGKENFFSHPVLGGYSHMVMALDIIKAREEYRKNRPMLHKFFCDTYHPNILLNEMDPASGVNK